MASGIKPLDPQEATLDVEVDVAKIFAQKASRSLQVEKFTGHPGKKSRRIALNFTVRRGGAKEAEKQPITLRVSSRDARQLARLFADMADTADGIV